MVSIRKIVIFFIPNTCIKNMIMVYYQKGDHIMILEIRVENFLAYAEMARLSMCADMRIKKFNSNVCERGGFNVLKSACIYGANNVGKSCLVRAMNSIVNVMLGYVAEVPPNIFLGNSVCAFGVTFDYGGKVYSYDFSYDSSKVGNEKRGFVYERFAEIAIDRYGNMSESEIFVRDMINNEYRFASNAELSMLLGAVSASNILIYTINGAKYKEIENCRNIMRAFAESVDIIDTYNIPIEKTLRVLKGRAALLNKTVELIKFADLDIDDYVYLKDSVPIPNNELQTPYENALQAVAPEDILYLASVHKGKAVQSLTFDSTGTKKLVALASYIADALTNGRILVVDELDSSLHFKLTRAIVTLFNNELNVSSQLIFTIQDALLLDCKKLFRKDQIWFAAKNDKGAYIYPLLKYTAQKDNIRSETDLIERYKSGDIGELPDPDFMDVLLGESKDE